MRNSGWRRDKEIRCITLETPVQDKHSATLYRPVQVHKGFKSHNCKKWLKAFSNKMSGGVLNACRGWGWVGTTLVIMSFFRCPIKNQVKLRNFTKVSHRARDFILYLSHCSEVNWNSTYYDLVIKSLLIWSLKMVACLQTTLNLVPNYIVKSDSLPKD